MNRTASTQANVEQKSYSQHQNSVQYTYEGSYSMYTSNSSMPSSINQPLPGQPPLPPMPPPPGALPPLPHVFGPVPPQVASIQTWAHPPPHTHWQWVAPPATALQPQAQRDMANNTYQRDLVVRNNYVRHERFNHNRNNVYSQRNNFHRYKNRRPQQQQHPQQLHPQQQLQQRFEAPQAQFDSTAYYGQALTNGVSIDWQRTNMAAAQNEALMKHIAASHPGHQMTPATQRVAAGRVEEEADQSVKVVNEVALKKTKTRKPMSQNYPSRPWNREDAESALHIENEYNKTIRAQSLIIKFPDPDLNKDIVREFHPGIQNIHFQSPSGPRYCFIQMSESVNIDDAIEALEKIKFGVGHLKVERKSIRDEDNPMPEEIDPYTLYVGNLPESVNVNEVKSKFPTAARVDVGYAQKMRNTRYAFIRYTNVEESIAAYKKAHNLMWDTRSIIVRFRRQRGNTCLPGESKNNCKKVKEEPSNEQAEKDRANGTNSQKGKAESRTITSADAKKIGDATETSSKATTASSAPVAPTEVSQQQPTQPWKSQLTQIPAAAEAPSQLPDKEPVAETIIISDIKEEPEDYDDMEMSYMAMDEGDDEEDDDDDEDDEYEAVREDDIDDIDDIENDNMEEYDEEEDVTDEDSFTHSLGKTVKDTEPSDELDQMFGDLENSIVCDIAL